MNAFLQRHTREKLIPERQCLCLVLVTFESLWQNKLPKPTQWSKGLFHNFRKGWQFQGSVLVGRLCRAELMIARKQRDILCISSLFFPPLLHPDPQLRDGAIRIQGKSSLLINPLWKYLIATSHPSQLSGQDKQSHSHYVT